MDTPIYWTDEGELVERPPDYSAHLPLFNVTLETDHDILDEFARIEKYTLRLIDVGINLPWHLRLLAWLRIITITEWPVVYTFRHECRPSPSP